MTFYSLWLTILSNDTYLTVHSRTVCGTPYQMFAAHGLYIRYCCTPLFVV